MNDPNLRTLAIQWLMNQGVSTVLLLVLIVMIAYVSDYALKVAIPAHIKSIQDGYERHVDDHRKEVESIQLSYERSLKLVADAFAREVEMISKNKE